MITFSRLSTDSREPPQVAKEIWFTYLQPDSPKCVGAISPEILAELGTLSIFPVLNSPEQIIFAEGIAPPAHLFDELGEGCYDLLDEVYLQYVFEHGETINF